jgi:hypothetical protein
MLSEQRAAHTYAIFAGSPVGHDGVRGDYGRRAGPDLQPFGERVRPARSNRAMRLGLR